jgi:hypothetical protein
MHNAVIAAAAVALIVIILFARLRIGFAVVVASTVLLPGSLAIRNPVTPYALFTRLLLVVLAVKLVLAIHAGVASRRVLRWTTLHTAFVVFLAAEFVVGVIFSDAVVRAPTATAAALLLVDQFVFFAVALACVRAIDDLRWVLGLVSVVLVASAGIGIIEHFTKDSWGHFIYGHEVRGITASDELTPRANDVRVKAGAEYPLQYGWVTAMMLPALLAWLGSMRIRWQRWVPLTIGLVGVVLLAEYWSFSRTSLAAFAVVAVITPLAARNPRLLLFTGCALLVGVLLFVFVTRLQQGFVGLPSGPVDVRTRRLPLILQIGMDHPWRGMGLGGLASVGVPTTDSTYLQLYGDTGIVGVVTGLALVACAGFCCLRGLRAADRVVRLAAATALAATMAMLVGGGAYDALRSLSSSRPFWLLAAIGVVAAEQAGGQLPAFVRRPRWLVAGALVGAEIVGVVAYALAPVHYAVHYQFQTVPVFRELLPSNPATIGSTYANTVCGIVEAEERQHPNAVFDCALPDQAAGVGTLRIQAPTAGEVRQLADDVRTAVQRGPLRAFDLSVKVPMRAGRDTPFGWAPLWLPLSVALALWLLPMAIWPSWRRWRRTGTMWGELDKGQFVHA